jgi:hypothetical protein
MREWQEVQKVLHEPGQGVIERSFWRFPKTSDAGWHCGPYWPEREHIGLNKYGISTGTEMDWCLVHPRSGTAPAAGRFKMEEKSTDQAAQRRRYRCF